LWLIRVTEANISFIHVKPSTILDKYVGESEKLISSVFSLAHKIAPCVLFIDEMDTLLRQRTGSNVANNVLSSALGVFLSEWDGLTTRNQSPVIVLGATNRPADIDPAFLRRMPLKIKVAEPDAVAREEILRCLLRKEGTLSDCINLPTLAELLQGFTGSDLKEVCRLAGISRMKRIMAVKKQDNLSTTNQLLLNEDFVASISRMFAIRDSQKGMSTNDLFRLSSASVERHQRILESFLPGTGA
jgi:ATPase family AAA domain-containing protein 1